ncbi:OmpW family protein [Parasphingorhabdus sp. SCSIO 66989]|uniref:OmpW family protein n=2 Tax=Alterisphingorhabdus coralli TaxID=3071408 RepID=A0AA97FBF1_9SPHN|nr:OmpW family protein [Parasphingorhabdus sp. SCSIO 66989]WOE76703.1 OmpW family protein [Parasphingorhabdus sp. SCSIO 66989]
MMKILATAASLGAMMSATPAFAEQGDWLLRVRAINVAPSETSSSILPAFPGERVSVDNSIMPEVDITYMATDNIGFELIAATTQHTVSGRSGTTGAIGELADTWVLPPTLTAQYHFVPDGKIRPYVGAGINYTLFYEEDASNGLVDAVGATNVDLDDSFGFALQAGVDIELNERFFLNFDIKYLDIDTTATLNTTAAGTQRVNVSLDPVVVGVGLGIKL